MDSQPFSGFPKEGVQFLADLVENNNREWFQANKKVFQEQLQKPAQQFVIALGMRLQEISPSIRFDTRTNGSGSLMRIYRDIRFSKDKTPYKTHVSMAFWEGSGKKLANPAFLVRFGPSSGGIYAGQYIFDKIKLDAFREAVNDDQMGHELEEALAEVSVFSDYEIGGDHYKRVPRGYNADHPRAELLKYKGLHASSPQFDVELVTTPELVEICAEHCQNMAPLQQWLVRIQRRSAVEK